MVTKNKEIISEFDYEFDVPNTSFDERIQKSLKVTLIRDRHQSYGYSQDNCFFEVNIPKYLKDYLNNTFPEYDEFEEDAYFKTKKRKFTYIVRYPSLKDVIDFFTKMTSRALFLKETEKADEHNKIILISSSSSCKISRDNYNFADMNKKLDLSFQFFVAYEMGNNDTFFAKGRFKYFGLKRCGNQSLGDKDYKAITLPFIPESTINRFKKIKWTQEREDYLTQMQNAIVEIQDKIHNFVDNISDDNIDKLLQQSNIPKLMDNKDKNKSL